MHDRLVVIVKTDQVRESVHYRFPAKCGTFFYQYGGAHGRVGKRHGRCPVYL